MLINYVSVKAFKPKCTEVDILMCGKGYCVLIGKGFYHVIICFECIKNILVFTDEVLHVRSYLFFIAKLHFSFNFKRKVIKYISFRVHSC